LKNGITQTNHTMTSKHIHYLMPHGMGDIVTVVPVLKYLSESGEISLSISVKGKLEADVIRLLCPQVEFRFFYFQEIFKSNNPLKSFLLLARRIRQIKPDIIIAQFGVDSKKSSLLSLFSGAKVRIGWAGTLSFLNTNTLRPIGQHKINENIRVLHNIKMDFFNLPASYPEYISTGDTFEQSVINELILKNPINIVISPGSGEIEKHKRWPSRYYSSLISMVLSNYKNITIFLVGSSTERDLCENIRKNSENRTNVHNLAGQTNIKELLELLSRAQLTITNCNGVSHLACTTKSRIIGLYGPTDHRITGPKSPLFIPVTAGLECAPCYAKEYITGCGNPICMERISVESVFEIVCKNLMRS